MRILGISGSPRKNDISGTYRMVKTLLEATGIKYDLISLRGKNIQGCVSCMGCVKDNVCVLNDDMRPIRDKIANADAYVIGSPNYYSGINANLHALLERFFQFRHRNCEILWGKPAVAVGVGGVEGCSCVQQIQKFMAYNLIETIADLEAQGTATCFTCGFGEKCKMGVPVLKYGPEVKITRDMIPDVEKDPQNFRKAKEVGQYLGERLAGGHKRQESAVKMKKKMVKKFK